MQSMKGFFQLEIKRERLKDTTSGPPCWMLVKRMLSKNERWIWEARFGKTGGWAGARLPVERDKEVNSYLSRLL